MNHIKTIAKKELRAYLSPVALIFLGIFGSLFALFFRVEDNVFIRNLVDIRPLFRSLPVLLIFLVSDHHETVERRAEDGHHGDFAYAAYQDLASRQVLERMNLSCCARIDLVIASTVDQLGELDWGPVVGVISAPRFWLYYLSIGSAARTDNQIVL